MNPIMEPLPALRPYVESIWISTLERGTAGNREHVLPSGQMHLAIRLAGGPVRLFAGPDDRSGSSVGDAVLAGARAGYYIKDMSLPTRSIGVQLRPGAAAALFGVSAGEMHARHASLDDLWGISAVRLREQLQEALDDDARMQVLQTMLLTQLRPYRALHPAVAELLGQLHAMPHLGELISRSGCSHRHLIARFREATGLSPKRYARVLRFGRLLRAMAAAPASPMGELALAAGYSDQSHCSREFREFSGTTPEAYRRSRRAQPIRAAHHAVVVEGQFPARR